MSSSVLQQTMCGDAEPVPLYLRSYCEALSEEESRTLSLILKLAFRMKFLLF